MSVVLEGPIHTKQWPSSAVTRNTMAAVNHLLASLMELHTKGQVLWYDASVVLGVITGKVICIVWVCFAI